MKKIDFIFVVGMIFFLGVFGIVLIFCPKKQYSNLEKRIFEGDPHITIFNVSSKNKIASLENFYQEQMPYRSHFLEFGINIKRKLGMSEFGNVYFGKNGYLLEKPKKLKQSKKFISIMNEFHKKNNDVNMSLLLLPSHVTINPGLVEKQTPIFDEYEELKSIYHNITFNTIDVIPTLLDGNKEYDMYYHLDSHITSYGAYYVYKIYAELSGITPNSFQDFEIKEVTNSFSGNLVKDAYMFSWKKDNIVIFLPKKDSLLEVQYEKNKTDTLYIDELLHKNYSYDYFLGRDEPIVTITNLKQKEKELLVVKDDSANAIIPFLVNHYSKVHVIDTNFYKQSVDKYLKAHREIKDVLFIYGLNHLDKQRTTLSLE